MKWGILQDCCLYKKHYAFPEKVSKKKVIDCLPDMVHATDQFDDYDIFNESLTIYLIQKRNAKPSFFEPYKYIITPYTYMSMDELLDPILMSFYLGASHVREKMIVGAEGVPKNFLDKGHQRASISSEVCDVIQSLKESKNE